MAIDQFGGVIEGGGRQVDQFGGSVIRRNTQPQPEEAAASFAGLPDEDWVGPGLRTPIESLRGGRDYNRLVEMEQEGNRAGFWSSLTDVGAGDIPFAGDFIDAGRVARVANTARKLRQGVEVTDQEVLDLNWYLKNEQRKQNATTLGKAGNVIKESVVFGVELFSIIGAGKKVAATAGIKTARKAIINSVDNLVGKYASKRAASMAGKATALAFDLNLNAAVYDALRPGTVLKGANERILTQILNGEDEDKLGAFFTSLADVHFEHVSEFSGEHIGKGVSKLFNKVAPNAAGRLRKQAAKIGFLSAMANRFGDPRVEAVRRTLKKVGYDGVVNEMYEERFGGFLRGLFGVDTKAGLASALREAIPTPEQLTVEALAFSIPSIGVSAYNSFVTGVNFNRPTDTKEPTSPQTPVSEAVLTRDDADTILGSMADNASNQVRDPFYSAIRNARDQQDVEDEEKPNSMHNLLSREIDRGLEAVVSKADTEAREGKEGEEADVAAREASRKEGIDYLKGALALEIAQSDADRAARINAIEAGQKTIPQPPVGFTRNVKAKSKLSEDLTAISKEEAKVAENGGIDFENDVNSESYILESKANPVTQRMLQESRDISGNPSLEATSDIRRMFDVKTDGEATEIFEALNRAVGATQIGEEGLPKVSVYLTPRMYVRGRRSEILADTGHYVQDNAPLWDEKTGEYMAIPNVRTDIDGNMFVGPYAKPVDIAEGSISAGMKSTGGIALTAEAGTWDKRIDRDVKRLLREEQSKEDPNEDVLSQLQMLDGMGEQTAGRFNRFVKMFGFHRLGWRTGNSNVNTTLETIAPPSLAEAQTLDRYVTNRTGLGTVEAARAPIEEEVQDGQPSTREDAADADVAPGERRAAPEGAVAGEARVSEPAAKQPDAKDRRDVGEEAKPRRVEKKPAAKETKAEAVRKAKEETKGKERVRAAAREEKLEQEIQQERERRRKEVLDARVDVQESQRRLVQYINDNLPPNLRGRFLARVNKLADLVKPETKERYLEQSEKIVDEIANRQARNSLLNRTVVRLAQEKRRLATAQARKVKGDIEANRKMEELINSVSTLSEKKSARMEKTLAHFDNNPAQEMPKELQDEIGELFMPNVNQMSDQQLRDLNAEMDSIRKTGKLKFELKELQAKRALDRKADIVERQQARLSKKEKTSQFKQTVEAGKPTTKLEKFARLAREFGWQNLRAERILNWYDNFAEEGINTKEVFDRIWRSEMTKLVGNDRTFNRFKEIHSKIDIARASNEPVITVDYRGEKIDLTLEQMMFIYANSKNDGNRAHLNGTGIPDAMIDDISSKLPAEAKQAVDAMIEFYDENYKRVSRVFAREFNVDLPKEENYFPIRNLELPHAEDGVLSDAMARFTARYASVAKGHTKKRMHSKTAFKRLSYFRTVVDNLRETEHYIAYNDAVRDINSYLNNKTIGDALKGRSEEAYQEIRKYVRDVARGRIRRNDTWLDNVSEFLRTNYATSVLGFNFVAAIKQLASFAQGLRRVDKKFAVEAAKEFMREPKRITDLVNSRSAFMNARGGTFQRELSELMEQTSTKRILGTESMFEKFKEASFGPIRAMDGITTRILWYAKFKEQADQGKTSMQAIDAADKLIRTTQPIGDIINLPGLFRAGGVERAYTLFKNQLNQNINLVFETGANYRGVKDTAWDIMMFIIVPSFLIHLASSGGEDPWKNKRAWARAGVSQVTGGIPYFNVLIDSITRRMVGEKRAPNFLFSLTPPNLKFIEDLAVATNEQRPEKMLNAAAKLSGVPFTQLRRTYKGIEGFKETGDPRRLVWSEFALRRNGR